MEHRLWHLRIPVDGLLQGARAEGLDQGVAAHARAPKAGVVGVIAVLAVLAAGDHHDIALDGPDEG